MVRALAPWLLATALALPSWSAETAPDAGTSPGVALAAARTTSPAYQVRLSALRAGLDSPDATVRREAIRQLGSSDDPVALADLLAFLARGKHETDELSVIATALGTSGNPAAIPALRKLSAATEADVRFAAYNALGQLAAATPADHTQRAKDEDRSQHLAGLTNLGTIKHAEAAALLVAGLNDARAIVRRQCAIGLGRLGDPAHGLALQNALSDADPGVRQRAAEAIAAIKYRPAIPYIIFALDANVAGDELHDVLKQMTGQDFGFRSTDNPLRRREAVDRGFAWWTAHSKDGA